jgi:hypothetical protein
MSRKKTKDRVKLPKRLLGVKIPKATRKSVNAMLKDVPAPALKPLMTMAVGGLVTALAARFEAPLQEFIDKHTPDKPKSEADPVVPTAH